MNKRSSLALRLLATATLVFAASGAAHAQATKAPSAPSAPATIAPADHSGTSAAGVPTQTVVAAAKSRLTAVYSMANATAKPFTTLDNRKNFSGRHVFVVLQQTPGWIEVKVPIRPNGKTGWVKASDVTLFQHDYAISVSLSSKSLVVYKAGKEYMRETVAIGASKWPTPTGTFFIRELARPSNPRGAYGPFAFGLSGYSNVLTKFGRGDGQIGIHGTNQPKALGTAVSHGCIRMRNDAITKLARTLPQGTPVTITA